MHDNGHRDDPQAVQNEPRDRRHRHIDDEEIHRHAPEHLRARHAAIDRVADEFGHTQKAAMELTSRGAPKMINTPTITVPP